MPLFGIGVDQRANSAKQRVRGHLLLAVAEVESVVQVFRVFALVVLDDRFDLVQSFDQACFGAGGACVFVPQRKKFCVQSVR